MKFSDVFDCDEISHGVRGSGDKLRIMLDFGQQDHFHSLKKKGQCYKEPHRGAVCFE